MKTAVTAIIAIILTRPDMLETSVFHNIGLNGVHFLDDVLFEIAVVRSFLECAAMCARHPSCVTFTYTRLSAGHHSCRGHVTAVTSASTTMSVSWARTYQVIQDHQPEEEDTDWQDSSCTTSDQCPEPESECFSGACLCSPGYYYSEGSNACVDSCQGGQLGSALVMYPGSRLTGNNYDTIRGVGPSTCESTCLSDSSCRAIMVHRGSGDCFLKSFTVLDDPDRWTEGLTTHDYFQRTCN